MCHYRRDAVRCRFVRVLLGHRESGVGPVEGQSHHVHPRPGETLPGDPGAHGGHGEDHLAGREPGAH